MADTGSEMPPSGRHLEFNGRHIGYTCAYNFETKTDRDLILVSTPTFLGSRNPVKSLLLTFGVGHIEFQDGRVSDIIACIV